MEEQPELEALGVWGEWFWGNDLETAVFAQAFGEDLTLIFRFTFDKARGSQSLVNRIVCCYHDLTDDDNIGEASFPDRRSMRRSIWSTVATVWSQCSKEPALRDPAAIVDVYDSGSSQNRPPHIVWRICHEELFNDYLNLLVPVSQLDLQRQPNTVDFNRLVRQNQLGGRGSTTLVHSASNPESQFVFKGIDFRTFLDSYESGHAREEAKIFYRSVKLISSMPRHSNIMAPPLALVTIQSSDGTPLVCGTLHLLSTNGTVASQIEEANQLNKRISPARKAHWCYQMVAAVAHTHLVAQTYHMDIKPGNFLLDKDLNLVLIDWEQSDAPVSTVAPEVDGTWDVKQLPDDLGAELVYTKYTGPERRNMPEITPGNNGWNVWNVFPIWNKQCPKALELAEVFSLGRSMWMLLRQPDMSSFEDLTCTDEVEEDWVSCKDIPDTWKRNIERCLKRNPNERIRLRELLDFWDNARRTQE